MSISEKRTVIVALHKLGIPIDVSFNEKFDIKKFILLILSLMEMILME